MLLRSGTENQMRLPGAYRSDTDAAESPETPTTSERPAGSSKSKVLDARRGKFGRLCRATSDDDVRRRPAPANQLSSARPFVDPKGN